ncbi:MAG TPA: hypothetical protein VHJ99_02280 [Candidatus Dormibacteraeota bacterium]|jgi:hypothetical protein|nr:hypothetical protein [Candidatus Dormibacteraeota bacterium]
MGFAGLAAVPASADQPSPTAYRQAVQDAYDLVRAAAPNDTAPAHHAISVLQAGTGHTQPEILNDLQHQPPAYDDARARLVALLAALDQPANTSDPQLAQQRLHDVLSMHRYDALHQPPSLLDRFVQWVTDRFKQLLSLLFGGSGPQIPNWFFYVFGAIVVGAVAVIVFLSARGRFTEGVMAGQPTGPRAPADYFSEADRLAAKGDRVGAIRALCAGVAATLAGERTWEGSPLTVREIFQRSPDPAHLRPLLLPFEAAVYGGRDVDAATYERASKVAAQYRRPAAVAA